MFVVVFVCIASSPLNWWFEAFQLYLCMAFLYMQIQINKQDHKCASTQRVEDNTMASIKWVAERAVQFLKKKTSMGATEMKKELKFKYGIDIPYQTVYNGTRRASDQHWQGKH